MRLIRPLVLAIALMGTAAPAYADFTFIIGSNTTPSKRTVKGFAFGSGGAIATEFEYANNGQDLDESLPGLRTFMGNVLIQTPFYVAGFQPYATAGLGYYRERLEPLEESGLGFNTGVGIKRTVFGPLKVRFDYRVFKLRGDPFYSTVHRIYTGVHLAF